MKSTLSAYVTVYKDVADVANNGVHYRNVAVFLPLTVSFNASGHSNPLELAVDLLRLWDALTGKDLLLNSYLPGDVLLFYCRAMGTSRLVANMGFRVVGLTDFPNLEVREWGTLESVVSHLLTLTAEQAQTMVQPVTMAEHFANVARHASTSHLWIFGQGDFALPSALKVIYAIFMQEQVPDIISLPVAHSISFYQEEDGLHDSVQMRHLEAISGTIYNRDFLRHMPEQGKSWWPHLESVVYEARTRAEPLQHLLLGKRWGDFDEGLIYVVVAPFPNWLKSQRSCDEVFIECFQVALRSTSLPCDRLAWSFSLSELDYCDGLVERGLMPAGDMERFWKIIASSQSGQVHVQPGPAVIVPIRGLLDQQILGMSVYLKLQMEGHEVFADMDEAELQPHGLNMQDFTPCPAVLPRTLFRFAPASAQLLQFGMAGLSQPRVHEALVAILPPIQFEKRLEEFGNRPYACIHKPAGRPDQQLVGLLARLSGLVENVVVCSPEPLEVVVREMLGLHFKCVVEIDAAHDYADHCVVRNARVLICSNSWFDITAAGLNPQGLVLMPQSWCTELDANLATALVAAPACHVLGW